MRIIHLACVAPPEIGGIGQVAYDEVVGLRARGIDAQLISVQGTTFVRDNATVARLPRWVRIGNASIVKNLDRVLETADIIHLHYPWYGVMERLLWRAPSKPVIVTFHMDAIADDWRAGIFHAHRWMLQERLLRHAAKLLVSSRDYAEHSSLQSLLPELSDRVVELPFGVDADFFSPVKRGEKNAKTILFVGGLDRAHSFKGLSVLLEAMTYLSQEVSLRIIGDGDMRASFEETTQRLGLRARVLFVGRVDREALRKEYRQASVLAFPSVSGAEAFGLVALEAQACGTPVVASSLPGVRTVVVDQETGMLVPPGDVTALAQALKEILSHDVLRERLAAAARARVLTRYSQAAHLERLEAIYTTICSP